MDNEHEHVGKTKFVKFRMETEKDISVSTLLQPNIRLVSRANPFKKSRRLLNCSLVEAGGDVCELLPEPGLRVAVRDVHEGGRGHLLHRVFTKFRILEIS